MTLPGFKDYFSAAASDYATFRPRYPAALFEFVASLPVKKCIAWDCATGNGQAALPLAEYFEQVIATDASAEQLAHAVSHPRVSYRAALAHASGIEPGTVDLVTVAQALHWLPLDPFFAEVRRVIAPGGALAVWCYSRPKLEPDLDAVVERYYSETCGPYWSPERARVVEGYRSIGLPIDEVPAPRLAIESALSLDELAGYIRTWSATRKLAEAIGRDPVTDVEAELRPMWGDATERQSVRWPVNLRGGRVM